MIPFADLLVKINAKPVVSEISLPAKQYEVAVLLNNNDFAQPSDIQHLIDSPSSQISVHLKKLIDKGIAERKRLGAGARLRFEYRLIVSKNILKKIRENRMPEVRAIVIKSPGITTQEIAASMGKEDQGIRYYIDTLVRKGIIKKVPTVVRGSKNGSRAHKYYPMVAA